MGNDGALDLFVANGHNYPELEKHPEVGEPYRQASQLFLGDGAGRFHEVPVTAESRLRLGRVTAVGDLNGDGSVDVIVNNLGSAPDLFLAQAARGGWARLHLVGTTSNRDGLGAVVRAQAGASTLRRAVHLCDGILRKQRARGSPRSGGGRRSQRGGNSMALG